MSIEQAQERATSSDIKKLAGKGKGEGYPCSCLLHPVPQSVRAVNKDCVVKHMALLSALQGTVAIYQVGHLILNCLAMHFSFPPPSHISSLGAALPGVRSASVTIFAREASQALAKHAGDIQAT